MASLAVTWTSAKTLRRVRVNNDLLEAAQRGDPAAVRSLLNSGADPASRSEYDATALHLAESADDTESVMLLAEHGADINARDRSGRTVLQRASIRGDVNMVGTFLDLGIEIENADVTGRTALNSAAAGGHAKVVEALLSAGASMERVDRRGMTPLHMAAANRHLEVIEVLVKHGVNPRAPSRNGMTPAIVALRRQSGLSPFDRFRPSGVVVAENSFGRDGRPGLTQLVRRLAIHGADLQTRDPSGYSVLQLAVGQIDGVTYDELRRRGAAGGPTAELLLSIWLDRTAEARSALQRGALVDGRTPWGESALWLAACLRRQQTAELLLQRGANPNLGRGPWSTPLVIASGQGDVPMVRLLLKNGAQVNISRPSPIERLQTPLLAAISRQHAQVARLLLAAGADVNQSDWSGHTPLMVAASRGNTQIVRQLLDGGALPNTVTEDGDTALGRACLAEHFGVVQLLLQRGADPTTRNDQDRSLVEQLDLYRSTASERGRQRARIVALLQRAMEAWAPSPDPVVARRVQ